MQDIEQVFVTCLIRVVTLCQPFSRIIISDDLISLSDTAVFCLEPTELPWRGVCGGDLGLCKAKNSIFLGMLQNTFGFFNIVSNCD